MPVPLETSPVVVMAQSRDSVTNAVNEARSCDICCSKSLKLTTTRSILSPQYHSTMSVSSSRDDLSRIALGSIDDWQRIQQDVASNVEEILAATLAEREPLSEEDKAMVSKLLETVSI